MIKYRLKRKLTDSYLICEFPWTEIGLVDIWVMKNLIGWEVLEKCLDQSDQEVEKVE